MFSSPGKTAPNAGLAAGSWFGPWQFAALLGLLILACFPQVFAGYGTFFFRDYSAFGYPLAAYHKEMFWRGELPLWNPYNNCGLPFLAQWNTLTLYPLSLFYLLLPLPWSLGVFCLGHLFLAGLGMYFLARRWTGNSLAAAVAGVAFAWNGLTWHSLMWPNDIAALGWMPWVILALERAWREGGRRILLAGLVGAMQMLAGAPEIILQTWFLAGCLWLLECFRPQSSRRNLVLRPLAVGLLITGLAAAQLLPFLDLLAHSQRTAAFGSAEWAMPAGGWANFLVALFHVTEPGGQGVRTQITQFWTASYYPGIGAAALALFAVWRVRHRRVWLLAALTLFSLLMALGSHGFLYAPLKKLVPAIGFMRFPIKFVVLAMFTLPVLAAEGLARLRPSPAENRPAEWRRFKWLGVLIAGLMLLIVGLAARAPQSADDFAVSARSVARGAVFLFLILGCLGLMPSKLGLGRPKILQAVLLALFWLDVFTHSANLSPTVSPSVYQPDSVRLALAWQPPVSAGESRAMQSVAAFAKIYFGAVDDPAADFLGRRLTLAYDFNLLDHLPKLDGFYSLYLREADNVIAPLSRTTNEIAGLENFLGIARITDPANPMEWSERKTYSPLLTAGQQPVFADDATALKSLFDPAFDGTKMVFLPPDARSTVTATNRVAVQLSAPEFSANRVAVQTQAAAPAMLVIAQAWYHPWHAYVDGRPVPLWRANYAFQALEVPAGTHRVQIIYQDNRFKLGGIISLATLFGCGVVLLLPRRKPPVKLAPVN